MEMESPICAIGFSEIDRKYTIEQIVGEILEKPTVQRASRKKNKDIVAEYLKSYGEDMYVAVRIVMHEEDEQAQIEVEQCAPYLDSSRTLEVVDLTVEEMEDACNYYVVCEDKETGIQFVFWLQNAIEYMDALSYQKQFNKVKIAALAMEGTIILPIEKDEQDEEQDADEREKMKVMMERARDGDEEAIAQLEAEEKEMDDQLKERMYQEDFLSIMSGYFIPTTLIDANYAILGEIKEMSTRKNMKTGEEMYFFTLDVNDLILDVMINKKHLIGYPTVGMRFMGTCWLQGTIETS